MDMAIETHFQSCDTQNLMIDFNSQLRYMCKKSEEQRLPTSDDLASHCDFYDITIKYHGNPAVFDFEEQIDEVDQYIQSQTEKFRITLKEQNKQQMLDFLKTMESKVFRAFNQKNEQIAEAAKKMAELEEFLKRLETENQSWRRAAQENEAMILSLYNTLEQMQENNSYYFNNGVALEEAESCCHQSRRNLTMQKRVKESNMCYDNNRVGETEFMACKCCYSRISCFMFLPCRHICSCNICEPYLQLCPVCRMPKKYSIETLIS